jgi:streptogramin lyase
MLIHSTAVYRQMGGDGLMDAQVRAGRSRTTGGRAARFSAALLIGCLLGIPATVIAVPAQTVAAADGVTNYTDPSISQPEGIAWGSDGALWFVNYGNNSIGRISTSGAITNYVSTAIDQPYEIAAGADGALWFTDNGGNNIGRITTTGTVSTYTLPTGEDPFAIAAGPDGNLWFTDLGLNSIGRITTAGVVTLFPNKGIDYPTGIAAGPDGAMWFTNFSNNKIGRITMSGAVNGFGGTGINHPQGITAGPDGALWFTNTGDLRTNAHSSIGRITTSDVVTNYTDPTIDGPDGIAAGPDGALWFTNSANNSIGRITTSGAVSNFTDSTINGPFGITAGPDGALWFANSGNNSIGRIITQGAVTADGSATCGGVSGQTTFTPPLATSATAGSESATTTIALTDCTQQDNSNIPGTSSAPATVTGTLTSTTTYANNSCATFLAGGASTSTLDWTANPAPTDGVSPTTLTATGTSSADDQSPSGDLGIQMTGAATDGSYPGPASMTVFSALTPAQFTTACGGAGGVSTFSIATGVVSAGTTVAGPAITSASSTTFTEGTLGSFAVALDDLLTSSITCVGNLPAGVTFVPSPNGGGGQLSGTPLPGSAGTYPLTFVGMDSSSQSTSQSFTLTVAPSTLPEVTGVNPSSGTNSLVPVTITGDNFTTGAEVDFGTVPATDVDVVSSTSITVEEPEGTASGPVDVTVTTAVGTSATGVADEFTYDLVPEAPIAVSADPEGLGMLVSWAPNASTDEVTSYVVTASVASGYTGTVPPGCASPAPVTVPGTDAAANVTGLCAGVPYTATVSATNSYGSSASSGSQYSRAAAHRAGQRAGVAQTGAPSEPVVPYAALAPSEPLITSVTARNASLIVAWSPPAQAGGDHVSSYDLSASAAGEPTVKIVVPAKDTHFTLKTLVNGVLYSVSLTANSHAGASTADASTGTPEAVIAPSAPAGFLVEPDGNGNLLLSWSPPTDVGTKPLGHYLLTYTVTSGAAPLTALRSGRLLKRGTSGSIKFKSKVTSYTLSGLSVDSYYNLSLVAVTGAGTSTARTTNQPVTPNVTLNPGTIELSSATQSALASDVGGVLTWPSPVPSQLSGLTAGEILAAPTTSALPDGLLALVQSVHPTASGGITVYTTDASPSQAFLTFTFSNSGSPPAGSSGTVRATAAGVTITNGIGEGVGSQGSFGVNYGYCGGNDVSACLNANVSYALDAGGDIDTFCLGATIWGDCIGIPLPDGVTVYANADLGANATVEFDINESTTDQLADNVEGVIPIFPGLVLSPEVIVTLNLSGSLRFQSSLDTGIGGGVSCSATLVSGVGCTTNDFQPIVLPPPGSPTASVSGTGTATLDVEGALCADFIACVNVSANFSLTGTINTSKSPYFSVCASLSVSAGVNLNLIIDNINDDYTLFTAQFGCTTQATGPPTLNVSANGQSAGSCSVPLGTNIQQFTATRSDGGSDPPITWKLENGIRGDSISSTGELSTAAPGGRTLTIQAADTTGLSGTLKCTVGTAVVFDPPSGLVFSLATERIGLLEVVPFIDHELVSWQAPVNTGGAPIVDYRLCFIGAASAFDCYDTGTATSYVVSDFLIPGTAVYTVEVWAINANRQTSGNAGGTFKTLGGWITSVEVTPSGNSEVVEITGSGFGNTPAGAATAAGCGATGSDYANNALSFTDKATNGTTWSAGSGSNCIGLDVLYYSDNEVEYEFGSFYGCAPKFTVQNGDLITVTVNGLQYPEYYAGS